MIIINEALLKSFHEPGRCESCGKRCKEREPHHMYTRGAGRLDIRCNLIALGHTQSWQCNCHRNCGGTATRARFLGIVAEREEVTAADIEACIFLLRRLEKGLSAERIEAAFAEVAESVAMLARRELKEAGILCVVNTAT